MRMALFGATGGTGQQVLAQALAQGHEVRALVRDPAKLAPQPGCTPVVGTVLDPAAVRACVTGTEAVVCVLGTRRGEAPVEDVATACILEAMEELGPRRIVLVTSLGVGDSRDQVPWWFKLLMRTALKATMAAKAAQEARVRASGLDWTLIRPGGLTDGARTGTYRCGVDPSLKAGRISRADVAEFVLKQLTDHRFVGQAVAIT